MKLSEIKTPEDIRSLSFEECDELADDIRERIIRTVSRNGGHLASNLGIVEITLALHRVFDLPRDKVIFDVGHQCYVHKLLTGRCDQFDTIRTYGGMSGFPSREESAYDCFETGHASTSISAALGMARARDLLGENHHVIAVIGDGALTGGMAYEAMNDCGSKKNTRLIVLLNDNGMSIAKNVGALSRHLYELRASKGWHSTKSTVRSKLMRVPLIGKPLYMLAHKIKQLFKNIFLNEGYFTSLGFHYLGPVDGNNQRALERMMQKAKTMDEPVLIHCHTTKGIGYNQAESHPETFHGTTPFLVESGESSATSNDVTYGKIANQYLCRLADRDPRIAVITAAMPLGSSTALFKDAHPNRFFDVGIAEEHAVTMCAGMASAGMRPFFFVYSTFLQRGYDQLLNDVALQHLPVVFMIDRAGLGNEDGKTHHGVYDLSYLNHIPGFTVLAPASHTELEQMIDAAMKMDGPCAIRYPKSEKPLPDGYAVSEFEIGKWRSLRRGTEACIIAVGSMVGAALRTAEKISDNCGYSIAVVNASTIKPMDKAKLSDVMNNYAVLFVMEENTEIGGLYDSITRYACVNGCTQRIVSLAVPEGTIPQGDHQHLLEHVQLDDYSLVKRMLGYLNKEGRTDG